MWLKNVKVFQEEIMKDLHVQIRDGHIASITPVFSGEDGESIYDGKGLLLLPSFLDMHCHLRDPGFTQKEDLKTGQESALRGGFTTICPMANTNPIVDTEETILDILTRAKELNLAEVLQVSAVTKGFGEDFVDFSKMRKHTFLFSNDGKPIVKESVMKEALRLSQQHKFLLMVHEEPEAEMIERDLFLQRKYGGNLHICHVSLEDSIRAIEKHKASQGKVSCEVTAHHIYRSEFPYKVHPPFRSERDRFALLEAIEKGIVDCLGTDHAPHTEEDKKNGSPGLLAFEFAFGMVRKTFDEGGISMEKLVSLTSQNPARLLGRSTPKIREGEAANLVLVDPKETYLATFDGVKTKSRNFPFIQEPLLGKIYMTVRRGEIKYVDRSFI